MKHGVLKSVLVLLTLSTLELQEKTHSYPHVQACLLGTPTSGCAKEALAYG